MPNFTTRLVTLGPPGAALDGVLDALHAAALRAGAATTVGQADRMPELPGQPDGAYTVVELTTVALGEHERFITAAVRALSSCGVPYAWRYEDCSWRYGAA